MMDDERGSLRALASDWQANGNSRGLGDSRADVWHECARQLLGVIDAGVVMASEKGRAAGHSFSPGPERWVCAHLKCSALIGESHADDCPYRHAVLKRRDEAGCPHEWLDRPESDSAECLICGAEE